jgi:glycine/D-amino acid oxidase-like deaminating enzyme/nitrite reductase/ring-hydroxylating ferredoxin subunit
VAAINRIEAVCRDEGIEADFARIDGVLVPARSEDQRELEKEFDACRKIEMAVEWIDQLPVGHSGGTRGLRFAGQGRFHPLKYCAGLAAAIERLGGRIHGGTAYTGHEESGDSVQVEFESGASVICDAAMFATNSPVNAKVAVHTKQVPMRTYAIAARVPSGSMPDILLWDTLEAYHYVRLQPDPSGDWLIVGGEDHRSGTADDGDERFARLESWARERFGGLGEVAYRWSGQVMEPVDFLPYSGLTPGSKRTYVHTGDSGMGMTNSVAGALNFAALLDGGKAHFADLFDPSRKPADRTSLAEFVEGQAGAVANLAEYLTPGDVDSADSIAPGEGAVMRRGTSKLAVYRGADGALIERSAVCTHVGCIVHWNGTEKCWDCPCHGSQFAPDGSVLNGPAVSPLAPAD